MIKFAISRDSWHYAYYQWVRGMYGHADITESKYEPASLCPYVQTMVWGSIFCVLSLPMMVFGWLYMRVARYACRWDARYFDRFLRWMETRTKCLDWLDAGPKNFTESPIFSAWAYSIMGIATAAIVVSMFAVMGAILYAFGYGFFNFFDVIGAIAYGLSSVGWVLFMGFYWLGVGLNAVWLAMAWLFTNGEFWYWLGGWAIYVLACLFSIGIVCLIVGVSVWSLSKIPAVKAFLKRLANLLNGFPEARKARAERITAEKAARAGWACTYCDYENPGERDYCANCDSSRPVPKRKPTMIDKAFGALFGWIATPFVWLRGAKGHSLKELSIWNVFSEFLYGVKEGVCPMVEFVDPGQLQAEAKAAAVERTKQDEVEAVAEQDDDTEAQ